MADEYDPDKDPIWLRRTLHRMFSVSAAVAASRQNVCQRCHEEKPLTAFAQFHGDTKREPYCDACSWFPSVLTVEEEQGLRAFLSRLETLSLDVAASPADPWERLYSPELRSKHIYVLGKTGTGKSTFLKLLARRDILRGEGLAFIDPHGDAVEQLLGYIPDERLDDVIYFAPATNAVRFNLLSLPYRPDKLAQDTVSLFEMFFADSWGPRLAHFLRFGLLTLLLDREPHSIRDLSRLLTNDDFRSSITQRITDPDLSDFWQNEFPRAEKQAVGAITNKLSSFLLPGSPLARLFSTTENDLDFSAIMNGRKILLVNLSKGELGEEPSRLLGGMIATAIQQAALARTTIPERQRIPFHLFVDEFHNYTVASFETILTEARKYQLTLTLAHQHLGQLPASLREAILGNVGTLLIFQCSPEDAATLHKHMRSTIAIPKDGYTAPDPLNAGRKFLRERTQQFLSEIRAFRDADGAPIYRYKPPNCGFQLSFEALTEGYTRVGPGLREWMALSDADLLAAVLEQGKTLAGGGPVPTTEVEWPTLRDFTNLEERNAFLRIGKAENVEGVFFNFPPDADPKQREKVIARQRTHSTPATSPAERKSPTEVPNDPEGFAF